MRPILELVGSLALLKALGSNFESARELFRNQFFANYHFDVSPLTFLLRLLQVNLATWTTTHFDGRKEGTHFPGLETSERKKIGFAKLRLSKGGSKRDSSRIICLSENAFFVAFSMRFSMRETKTKELANSNAIHSFSTFLNTSKEGGCEVKS